MASPNVTLNLPVRKQKGLIVHLGCITAPFYSTAAAAPEGAPVKIVSGSGDEVELVTAGSAGAGVVFGLLAQEVYDASLLGELSNYEFHNSTKARTGDTVGVVTGQGYVLTNNYTGSVAVGNALYPAASGKISATQVSSDVSIGVAEEAGTDGDTLIRVRINFATV
jgi:hypothetical protein